MKHIAWIALLLSLAACQFFAPKPSAECIDAKEATRAVGKSACIYGTVEVIIDDTYHDSRVILFQNAKLYIDVQTFSISNELRGRCIEVRGVVTGKPIANEPLNMSLQNASQLKMCGQQN